MTGNFCSDELEGRDTPSIGLDKAADYIAAHLARWRIKPAGVNGAYFQPLASARKTARNVIGMIEGSDPRLKHEYVALSAHYDHLGVAAQPVNGDAICNGADDNGSGAVGVMAIAEAMAMAKRKPKRSLLFIWHCGEERNFTGAKRFVAAPTVKLEQMVALINLDMIGRSKKPGDTSIENRWLTGARQIYVLGRLSSELNTLGNSVNRTYLKMNFINHDPDHYYSRSDHCVYDQKCIPSVLYTGGEHVDYHKPSDEIAGKIDFEKIVMVSRTVLMTLWAIADLPARPRVDGDCQRPPGGWLRPKHRRPSQ